MTEEATPAAAEVTATPAAATPEVPVVTAATETPEVEKPSEPAKPIVTAPPTSLLDGVASPRDRSQCA